MPPAQFFVRYGEGGDHRRPARASAFREASIAAVEASWEYRSASLSHWFQASKHSSGGFVMAWVRIDDQAPRNEKMLKAGPAACWLWVCGIAHCQSQLTDGFISTVALPMIGISKDVSRLASALVAAGLWEMAEGGYRVHDYLEFNQSKESVLAKRRDDSERKRTGESSRNPSGRSADSGAPRAGIPSHPIPTQPKRDSAPVLPHRGFNGGVLAGSLQRDHLGHAACSPNFAWCVPDQLHTKLANSLKPKHGNDFHKASDALKQWYPAVWQSLPADFTMGDIFRFWQPRFDAEFASKDPAAPVNGKREPVSMVPDVNATREYMRKQREMA